jgi:hypothetical protein
MSINPLKKLWTHLLIVFDGNYNYTIEGFERTQKKFELPGNLTELDPLTKRKATICNLFANQNLSIREIVHVLDSRPQQVIPTLIENQLIKERRRQRRGAVRSNENPLALPVPIQPEGAPARREDRTIIDGSTPSRCWSPSAANQGKMGGRIA